MSPHQGNMAVWSDIACKRGHAEHTSRMVDVTIGIPTAYHDMSAIPARYLRHWKMLVWDPDLYPIDGGPYCPAYDAVSETIVNLGVWSPDETAMAVQVLDGHRRERVLDFGSQVGWFSLLAASCGCQVSGYDADAENASILRASAALNGWEDRIDVTRVRVDADTPALDIAGPVRLAKIDVEGAERDVIRILSPALDAGLVEHLLIEITPVFDSYYPDLVAGLAERGYEVFMLPPKQRPPVELDHPDVALIPWRLDTLGDAAMRATVASWDQAMCWFKHKQARW